MTGYAHLVVDIVGILGCLGIALFAVGVIWGVLLREAQRKNACATCGGSGIIRRSLLPECEDGVHYYPLIPCPACNPKEHDHATRTP